MGEATVSFPCAHIQRQTCSPFQTDAGPWQTVGVKFSLCRQLSWETETCSVSHLPDATAVLARSAGLGGYALAREKKNPCQHGKLQQQRPVSLFTVAVQTMICSHCRINSQSFQLLFGFVFYSNSLWEKNKHGAVAELNLVPSHCVSSTSHMFTCQMPKRNVPSTRIFACSSKWCCTCWPTSVIVSGTLPSRALDNLVQPSDRTG